VFGEKKNKNINFNVKHFLWFLAKVLLLKFSLSGKINRIFRYKNIKMAQHSVWASVSLLNYFITI
jgi:hypothetical protein